MKGEMMAAPGEDGPILFHSVDYPEVPGLYFMKDAPGKVIFLGMTVNLRRHLCAFFEEGIAPPEDPQLVSARNFRKIPLLLARVRRVEVFLLPGEAHRVHLTNRLIEQLRPYFNLATFLDVTGYAYIRQTAEPYPRLVIETNLSKHKWPFSARFGPFPTGPSRTLLLERLNEHLKLRTCDPMPLNACYRYAIGECSAPCEGRISEAEYSRQIQQAATYLSAPAAFLDVLEAEMQSAADTLHFERASHLHDTLKTLRAAYQRMLPAPSAPHDQDMVYAAAAQDGTAHAVVLHLKRGWLDGFEFHDLPTGAPADTWLAGLLCQIIAPSSPPEIIVPPLPGLQALAEQLSAAAGHSVRVTAPAVGPTWEMLEVARMNFDYHWNRFPRP